MEFLLDAYLPEHYKNSTGSTRKVWGKYLGRNVQKGQFLIVSKKVPFIKPITYQNEW